MNPNRAFLPHPEEQMSKKGKRNTVCETLRKAYQNIEEGNPEKAKLKIRIAVTMAKAMDLKLRQYSSKYKRELFHSNKEEKMVPVMAIPDKVAKCAD